MSKFLNKKLAWLMIVAMTFASIAQAGPFISGQVLTATQLNSVVDSKTTNAAAAITGGTITGVTIDNSIIGGTTPAAATLSYLITNSLDANGYSGDFYAYVGASSVSQAGVAIHTAHGTALAPSATLSGDTIGSVDFWGYASAPAETATLAVVASAGFTSSSYPSQLNINLTPSASTTPATAASIGNTGVLTLKATTGGIAGTVTNDSAVAGLYGEYAASSVASTTVSLTTATTANMVTQSLTAGDYDVQGTCVYQTAATTSVTQNICGISTTSATLGTDGTYARSTFAAVVPGAVEYMDMPTPVTRISLAATTTVYLVAQSTFTVSTQTAGGVIRVRRVR